MLFMIFAGLAVIFIAYAIYTQYSATDATQSVPKRVWASLVAAVVAIGATIMAWFHGTP